LQNYYCSNVLGTAGGGNGEVALDIEMVISMAPDLNEVFVVEGTNGVDAMEILADPPTGYPLANQISSSWGGGWENSDSTQLMEMAAQGQAFFYASGDTDAPTNGVQSSPPDANYMTMVGGTELSMNGVGASWQSETVWNTGASSGSSGYVQTALSIPIYQHQVNTTANGGSSTDRNVPDVAMCADNVEVVDTDLFTNAPPKPGGIGRSQGTSAAAPLWAAFTALANQQAAAQGKPAIGFLNPTLYNIAAGPSYASCFHDITNGNNINTYSSGLYTAGPGYDNCTGLGSPNSLNMINALAGYAGYVYVEFSYTGSVQNGTYFEPYKTLAGGVGGVISGGTIFIKNGGSSSETLTISKPLKISAIGGTATVGN
jgi:subtilase family serine protease